MNSIGKKIYQIKLLEKNASKNDDFDKAIELKNKSDKLKNQIRLYDNLKARAEYILERTLRSR